MIDPAIRSILAAGPLTYAQLCRHLGRTRDNSADSLVRALNAGILLGKLRCEAGAYHRA